MRKITPAAWQSHQRTVRGTWESSLAVLPRARPAAAAPAGFLRRRFDIARACASHLNHDATKIAKARSGDWWNPKPPRCGERQDAEVGSLIPVSECSLALASSSFLAVIF